MPKSKLYVILLTSILAITTGWMNNSNKSTPTFEQINVLPAGTILDTAGLNQDEISNYFYSQELTEEILSRIDNISYRENPYITTEDLRYLRVLHVGFDGKTHIGELIVNQAIAQDVLEIMEELYRNEYPIEKMILIDEYNAEDEASMSDNNSSAFNYRLIA